MFKPLMDTETKAIIQLRLSSLQRQLKDMGLQVEFTVEAISYLLKEGHDPQFGARPLKRLITKEVINELSKMILADKIQKDKPIIVDSFENQMVFRNS
jgi:ATP-dependent Clp protease ATP-binding subunit ClpB